MITKEGSLGWKMCEGTILVCPAVRGSQSVRGDRIPTANKRARICVKVEEPIKSENNDGAIVKTDELMK